MNAHRLTCVVCAVTCAAVVLIRAQQTPHPAELLLPRAALQALDDELSGVTMKDHVSRLTQFHRVPASPGFHDAIAYLETRAREAGLSDVHVETFPGDTFVGTLRGNRGWRVEGGDLTEVSPRPQRLVSYDDVRVAVADNSESADVTAALVDVGAGTGARDYDGRDVKGKLVLADGNPGAVHRLAVQERGAAGIVSYNSNQQTGWWRDDQDLVRWGHLDANGRANTFALMISVRQARELQRRLAAGEPITLRARVRARNDDSVNYETLMATIPGTDAASGEIVFSCHLDHEKPGANDNASGCSAIMEIGRALRTLIASARLPQPRRTIRFVWPSEMTGTIAYLSKYPAIAARIKAAVHLDMVGGDPFVTKSILHVTRSPWSTPTATDDVAETFASYVIEGAYRGAADNDVSRAFRAAGGSKDAFWADVTPYESGSDHWIYQEGAFAIPTIYLRDWPDVYIHTNKDLPDNIEPTKIKRSAFIAAASGFYLALAPTDEASARTLVDLVVAGAHARTAEDARRAAARQFAAAGASEAERARAAYESRVLLAYAVNREQRRLQSIDRYASPSDAVRARAAAASAGLASAWQAPTVTSDAVRAMAGARADLRVPVRSKEVKGPLDPASDWVREKGGDAASKLAIARSPNASDAAYEIVNFIDGVRTVSDIRNAVSAEFEPIDLAAVSEYFELLAKIGAITFR